VERCKHYPDIDAFRADQLEMERRGWKASAIRTYDVPNGPLKRVFLRRPMHSEVDVAYTHEG
jgi:hypothetical protein